MATPQLILGLLQKFSWGGSRKGAGRKRIRDKGIAHRPREKLSGREPVLLTLRAVAGLPSFRSAAAFDSLRASIKRAQNRFGFRVIQYSVQSNHLHLIVEANDKHSLTKGASGLQIRIAKSLNKLFDRTGKLFSTRYHARTLRGPQQVRNALRYVLLNFSKHALQSGQQVPRDGFDPCSSARAFDGWTIKVRRKQPDIVEKATTWLLTAGWLRRGRISPSEVPG